jgi:hypothetical protein
MGYDAVRPIAAIWTRCKRAIMADDWRVAILRTQPYLRGVSFVRKPYAQYRPGWDHDHCVACGVRLAEPGSWTDQVIHEGYATTSDFVRGADYEWACPECFADFQGVMGWKVVDA